MKKRVIFILCFILALSAGKVMANSNNVAEKSSTTVAYAINLGDVSGMSSETMDATVNQVLDNLLINSEMSEPARCSLTITVSAGILSVALTVEADCSAIVEEAKKAAVLLKAALTVASEILLL